MNNVAVIQRPALVLYDEMCRAIEAAYRTDEVISIRTLAMQFEAAAHIARDHDSEDKARRIRQRAERRAGELLAQMEKAKGKRTDLVDRDDQVRDDRKTLADLGVSKQQSSDWQRLAEVPRNVFDHEVEQGVSTTAILAGQRSREKPPPAKDVVDPQAMFLWGHLQEFERSGLLDLDPSSLLPTMLDHQKATTLALAPRIAEWLGRLPI